MLAPCHSYLLTPSAPLGADRLIGSHCSTCESEEGKLRPLPCSLASFFHFTACFCWAPSANSLLVFIISPFLCALFFILIIKYGPPLALPTHFLLVAPLSLPYPSLALPCSASVIPTLLPFLSPDCTYPSTRACSATSNLAGHILCSSICWLDLQFHFINTVISFSTLFSPLFPSVSRTRSVRLCHHLHLPMNPSTLITFSTQSKPRGTNLGWLRGEKHAQSSKQSLQWLFELRQRLSAKNLPWWCHAQKIAAAMIIGVLSKFQCSNETRYPGVFNVTC